MAYRQSGQMLDAYGSLYVLAGDTRDSHSHEGMTMDMETLVEGLRYLSAKVDSSVVSSPVVDGMTGRGLAKLTLDGAASRVAFHVDMARDTITFRGHTTRYSN